MPKKSFIGQEPEICTPEIFFEKYKNGDNICQSLIQDLQRIVSDLQWFKEANRENEPICIDFCDALNTLSTQL